MVFGFENMPPELAGMAMATIGFMSGFVIIFVMLIIILFLTRGVLKPFMKAKLRGRTVMLLPRKDRKIEFIAEDLKGGILSNKNYGDFTVNPNDSYLSPNGVPMFLGYPTLGTSINPKFAKLATLLKNGVSLPVIENGMKEVEVEMIDKETGKPVKKKAQVQELKLKKDGKGNPIYEEVKINDISELEEYNEKYKAVTGRDLIVVAGSRLRKKEFNINDLLDAVKGFGSNLKESFRIQDLVDFFKYNVNPSYVQSAIESKLAQERMEERKLPGKIIMYLSFAVVAFAITYMIVAGFLKTDEYQTNWINCERARASCGSGTAVVQTTTVPKQQTIMGLPIPSGVG